jgi:BirA family biotin operon repressor/biotin-[acetyl-CoA-carboxylase] ligase
LVRPEDLPAEFAEALHRAGGRFGRLGSPLVYFASIGSTNDVAASLAMHPGSEGTTVIADGQTSGRGRRGHPWYSPPGSGLYVSVVLSPSSGHHAPRATQLVTIAAGLALAEGIEQATGLGADIKWPNDLFIGSRKFGGILAEGITPDAAETRSPPADPMRVVVGYGINVDSAAYPAELRGRATSLSLELGRPVDRAMVFVETLAALGRRYDDLMAGRFDAIVDGWRSRARGVQGVAVEWDTPAGMRAGVTCGIDGDGALLVRAGGRIERIVSGELRWSCF